MSSVSAVLKDSPSGSTDGSGIAGARGGGRGAGMVGFPRLAARGEEDRVGRGGGRPGAGGKHDGPADLPVGRQPRVVDDEQVPVEQRADNGKLDGSETRLAVAVLGLEI